MSNQRAALSPFSKDARARRSALNQLHHVRSGHFSELFQTLLTPPCRIAVTSASFRPLHFPRASLRGHNGSPCVLLFTRQDFWNGLEIREEGGSMAPFSTGAAASIVFPFVQPYINFTRSSKSIERSGCSATPRPEHVRSPPRI